MRLKCPYEGKTLMVRTMNPIRQDGASLAAKGISLYVNRARRSVKDERRGIFESVEYSCGVA